MKRRYVILIVLVLIAAGVYIVDQFSTWQHRPRSADPQQEQADAVRRLLR